jgi:hypothetical protein
MFTTDDGTTYRVVDVHQHMFGRFDGFDPGLRRVFDRVEPHLPTSLATLGTDPDAGVALLDSCGVDQSWVLAEEGPPSGFGADSLALVEYCAAHPSRLVPIGSINPCTRSNVPDRVDRLFEAGIRGIKLYASDHGFSPSDPRLAPVYERLQAERLPLMIHTGGVSRYEGAQLEHGRPVAVEPVLEAYPGMPLVLVHSGKGAAETEAEALDLFDRYGDVWLEISDLSPTAVARVCTEERAHRVLFGSDMPQFKPVQYRRMIEVVTQLAISEEAKRAVLAGNADRLVAAAPVA